MNKVAKEIDEYKRGKTKEEIAEKYGLNPNEIVSLASNENSYGPPPKAIQAIKENAGRVYRYPSPKDAERIRREIAQKTKLKPENVVLGTGSDGIMESLMKMYIEPGDQVIIPTPTFSYYTLLTKIYKAKPKHIQRNQNYSLPKNISNEINQDTKIIFICSPNNPTGNTVTTEKLKQILKQDILVVLDEAYIEFADQTHAPLVKQHDNLVVLRTFSKAYGLAGLRIGYALTNPKITNKYKAVSPPFPLAIPSIEAAIAALNDKEHHKKTIKNNQRERKRLQKEIPLKTYPSKGNYVFIDTSPIKATKITKKLMKKGVIVRDCTPIPGCKDTHIRITVGTPKENTKTIQAIKKITKK
ncbi:histidinol-phosphate transaminase [Methanonatronarchaeum sp. AMET-Sl]|uniref:histidinol-phosphate transaminase n=1 Tax=Methanonatronarchaeum sp. AMET-Sl TaxID=3037654 RepID=UPI00244E1058|nr:histidinol-phosphate transaminase [Methanonatronarchaeum sp. AMET-Sl]WGI18155.1 histidinol-phosphate transaminase [Methanonatronarchaeum sp. AMET-Sl]